MEENKRTQSFSGSKDFRSGRNLVNLRNDAPKADTSEMAQSQEEESVVAPEIVEKIDKRSARNNVSLNAFDRFFEWGIYLLVFMLPLFILPFSFEVQEFNKYFLLIFASSLLLFVWTLNSVFVKGQVQFLKSSITVPFVLFLLAILVSALLGIDSASSILGYYGSFSDSLVFYVGLFVFYLLSLSLLAQRGADFVIPRLIKSSVYSSILVSLISFLYFIGFKFLPGFSDAAAGFNLASGYARVFAIYLLFMLFISLYDFFSPRKDGTGKIVDFIAVVLAIVNLLILDWAAISFMLLIGLALVVVFGGFFTGRNLDSRSKFIVPVLFILSLVFAFGNLNLTELSAGKLASQPSSISASIRETLNIGTETDSPLLENALPTKEASLIASSGLKENPIVGSGIGTYYYDFSKYKSKDFNYDANWSVRFGKAYNEMLERVSTIGILGVLSYSLLILMALVLLVGNIRREKREIFILAAFLVLLVFQFLFLETAILKFIFVLLLVIASGNSFMGANRIVAGALPMQGQKKMTSFDLNGKISGKTSSVIAIAIILVCSAGFFFSIQFLRAETQYKALSADSDANSVDASKLEKVTSLNSYRGEYSLGLSRIYITRVNALLAADSSSEQGLQKAKAELDKTIYHTRRSTELSPNNVSFWENYGYVYRRMGDLGMEGADELALTGFKSALRLDPNNVIYRTEIGKIYLERYQKTEKDEQKMNLNNAKTSFEEAIALKNDYPDAVAALALVYFYEGNEGKSLETVNEARNLKKISVATAVQIGKIYHNLGKLAEAEEALKAAVKVKDDNSDAHYILGVIYKEQKRNSEALTEFRRVLELNPGNEDVLGKISELEKTSNVPAKKIIEEKEIEPEF